MIQRGILDEDLKLKMLMLIVITNQKYFNTSPKHGKLA
jgi:hypothetical protein